MHARTHARTHARARARTHAHAHAHAHTHRHTDTQTHRHTDTRTHAHTHTRTHTHTHTHTEYIYMLLKWSKKKKMTSWSPRKPSNYCCSRFVWTIKYLNFVWVKNILFSYDKLIIPRVEGQYEIYLFRLFYCTSAITSYYTRTHYINRNICKILYKWVLQLSDITKYFLINLPLAWRFLWKLLLQKMVYYTQTIENPREVWQIMN